MLSAACVSGREPEQQTGRPNLGASVLLDGGVYAPAGIGPKGCVLYRVSIPGGQAPAAMMYRSEDGEFSIGRPHRCAQRARAIGDGLRGKHGISADRPTAIPVSVAGRKRAFFFSPTRAGRWQLQGRSALCGHGRLEQLSTICRPHRRGRSEDISVRPASFAIPWPNPHPAQAVPDSCRPIRHVGALLLLPASLSLR